MDLKKIVVVRSDAIGDWLVTTPVLSALKIKFPSVHITVVASALNEALVREHPQVDQVLLWHNQMSVAEKADSLRGHHFDLVLIFHQTRENVLACWRAGIPHRWADSARLPDRFFLTAHTPVINADQSRHVVEANMSLLAPLQLQNEKHRMVAGINPVAVTAVQTLLKDRGWQPDQMLVGLHLSPGGANRTWPVTRYASVISALSQMFPQLRFVLTGLAASAGIRDELRGALPDHGCLIDMVGQTNLSQLSALTSLYRLFIGVDSGPYHLAVAHGVATVEIAPTKAVRPIRWAPWQVPHRVIRSPIACELYCDHHRCPVDDCLRAITPDHVAQAAVTLLSDTQPFDLVASRRDWFKKSQTIVLVDSGVGSDQIKAIATVLDTDRDIRYKIWDWRSMKITAVFDQIQADDVTTWIIHDPALESLFKVLRLLAPLRVFVPPLLVLLPAKNLATPTAWIDWLIQENQKLSAR